MLMPSNVTRETQTVHFCTLEKKKCKVYSENELHTDTEQYNIQTLIEV